MEKEENPRMYCGVCGHGKDEPYYPFTPWGLFFTPSHITQCPKCTKMSKHHFLETTTQADRK
jgi:hypothetical protein